jgi:hypothetical protein
VISEREAVIGIGIRMGNAITLLYTARGMRTSLKTKKNEIKTYKRACGGHRVRRGYTDL